MSLDELKEKKLQLEFDIAKIESKLEEAQIKFNLYHIQSDFNWLQRAKFALKLKKIELKEVNMQFQAETKKAGHDKKRIVEEEKTKRTSSIERAFMNIAKTKLSVEIYNEMLRDAMKQNNIPVRAKCSECNKVMNEVKSNRTYHKCCMKDNKRITKSEYTFAPDWCPLNSKS